MQINQVQFLKLLFIIYKSQFLQQQYKNKYQMMDAIKQQKQQIINNNQLINEVQKPNQQYKQIHTACQQVVHAWQFKHQKLKQPDHRFDQYIQMLKSYGAIISNKLKCGLFQLKNGLTYPGLYAVQQINPNLNKGQGQQQILVSIPVNMLLTTYKAENQSIQQIMNLFKKQQFYHQGPIWQNKILVTYVLYIMSYQKDSMWAKMASYFSKDIDIISFWDKEEIAKFEDKSVLKAAMLQRQNFQEQWKQFSQLQKQNKILQTQLFTYQNYKWIYTHVISRCFGSYINSTYFVPFCQFFNHNCVDVSYYCLEDSQYQQRLKLQKQTQVQIKQQEQQQDQTISSISQQSGNSEDYIQDGDFSYHQVPTYTIKWCSKISYNLKQKQKEQIQQLFKKLLAFLETQIKWKGFGLLYIGQIIQRCNLIVNQYMAERKKYNQAKQQLQLLLYHAGQFKRIVKNYFKGQGSNYLREKHAQILTNQISQKEQKKKVQKVNEKQKKQLVNTTQPPQKPYKYFIMNCHSTQNFPKNAEVYFEYNRLSNRTLLLRYGFCFQNNKYQHVWVRRSLAKQIGQYPDLLNKMRQKAVSIMYKIKLKPYVLNTEFIMLYKVQKWKIYGNVQANNIRDFEKMFGISDIDEQCEIIIGVIGFYQLELPKYQGSLDKDRGLIDLQNKQLGYHDYFRAVYHNQKIKILLFQINLLKKCVQILQRIKNEKIQLKGNPNLLRQLQKVTIQQMGNRKLAKLVWGYIKTLNITFN